MIDNGGSIARSDEALMAAVRDGEVGELGVLFDRHYARVRALCFHFTHARDAIEDLTQDVFLRVLAHRRSYAGRAAFTTWLYRIAYRVCDDYRRAATRATEVDLGDRIAAPTTATGTSARHAVLECALKRLAPDRRDVLVLSRFAALSYEEIGRIVGCTPGAARVRAHRAMRELRDICLALEEEDNDLRRRERDHDRYVGVEPHRR